MMQSWSPTASHKHSDDQQIPDWWPPWKKPTSFHLLHLSPVLSASHYKSYPFVQLQATVPALSLPYFLCTSSLHSGDRDRVKSGESLDIVQVVHRNRQIISVANQYSFSQNQRYNTILVAIMKTNSFPARSSTIAYVILVIFFFHQFKVRLPLKKQFIVQ